MRYNPYAGVFTLPGKKVYRVTAQLGWEAYTPEFYAFGLYDANTGEQIGPLAEALPPNRNTCNASGGLLDVIITTGLYDRKYRLKMAPNVTAGPSSEIRADVGTFLNIAEITADKSYLSTTCLTNQLPYNTWNNQIIGMIIQQQYGDIRYYPNVGVFTLPGGKTYRITAQLGWDAKNPEFYAFGLFDISGNKYGQLAESLPPNAKTWNASGGVLNVIFTTPARGGDYCLRMAPNVTAGPSSEIRADVSTFMNIVEM